MALGLGLMIEGQEGLTWDRWRRLARVAEDGGFDALFRSDHLTGLFGDARRPSLDTWASLTWLAGATTRIRFGPLVSPLTFHHPALLAKRAAAVAELAGGRLDLGIGAGWHEGEHRMLGIPFPPLKERVDRLECGARAIRALWQGKPVSLPQPYYPLVEAESHPAPPGGRVPLIIGARGRRTLRIVAAYADEWNVTRVTFEDYAAKRGALEASCAELGRDPRAIARSLMLPVIVGRTPAEMAARQERARQIFPRMPADEAGWRAAGFLYGTPAQVVADLRRWARLGVGRAMLQMLDMDDIAAMELLAAEVVPPLAGERG
jgi:alkanesulfonate monooxygenase SsuD/methylene tetrahydromethanopterin reductase-like flavin-dependent oxidoreductase (luciferase family)